MWYSCTALAKLVLKNTKYIDVEIQHKIDNNYANLPQVICL